MSFHVDDRPDPFERLPALAERLGVAPYTEHQPPTIIIKTRSGLSYDVFALVNAVLDRLDAATREGEP